jgi:hypothetical protein
VKIAEIETGVATHIDRPQAAAPLPQPWFGH